MTARIRTIAIEYNKLGMSYTIKGKIDSAITNFHKAIEIAPEYSIPFYNLGNAHKKNGNLEKANDCFKKAASLGHKNAQKYCTENNISWFI